MTLIILMSIFSIQSWICDFGNGTDGTQWQIVNDGVMGGVSTSSAYITDTSMIFFGNLSLENNGGFASVRSPYQRYDFTGNKTIEIRYRSKGGTFMFRFEQSRYFYNPYYAIELDESEEWTTLKMSLEDVSVFRMGSKTGSTLGEKDLKALRLGLMKADKKPGAFEIEIDFIKIY